jgi:hypothetical protein
VRESQPVPAWEQQVRVRRRAREPVRELQQVPVREQQRVRAQEWEPQAQGPVRLPEQVQQQERHRQHRRRQ